MTAAVTPVPTLPGVTDEQVREAMAIAERVFAEFGVPVRIEPRIVRDPEIRDWVTVEIYGDIGEFEPSRETALELARAVPRALTEAGLYFPAVPITTYF